VAPVSTAKGHTNRRIAGMLFISESTAGVHISNILGKLGVGTRAGAEEEWRRRTGRPMISEDLERVLRHPGDV